MLSRLRYQRDGKIRAVIRVSEKSGHPEFGLALRGELVTVTDFCFTSDLTKLADM